MADEADFARVFSEFQATYGNELRAKVARLDELIGRSHWLSVGTYKENLVRTVLANKLPKKYEVGTGFVLAQIAGNRVISKQIDLLIWNSHEHAPFFRDGEFVIIAPEALAGAIEVKSTLTTKELKKALNNLDSLMAFRSVFSHMPVIHRSIFAFDCDEGFTFPKSVFNTLNRHYHKHESFPLEERLRLSAGDYERWSFPWIDDVAVLDKGVVTCAQGSVNNKETVTYVAYSTVPDRDQVDAYGFVERGLLMDLILGPKKAFARYNIPGFSSAVFANAPIPVDTDRFIIFPDEAVTQVARLTGEQNVEWVRSVYHPPAVKQDEKEEGEDEEPGDED